MLDRNLAHFGVQQRAFKEKVWFSGSTAVRKGMGLCYDLDTVTTDTGETATDPWGRRGRLVAVPSTSNNNSFAGYATQAYSAKTGGQEIEIYVPGSICEVEVGIASTILGMVSGSFLWPGSTEQIERTRQFLDGLKRRAETEPRPSRAADLDTSPAAVVGIAVAALGALSLIVILIFVPLQESLISEETEKHVTLIQNLVRAIRDIENKYNVTKADEVSANAQGSIVNLLNDNAELICLSAYTKKFSAGEGISKPENAATAIVEGIQVFVHNVVDVEAEKARLEKQKEQVEKAKKGTEAKLANENFVSKAKPEVVEQAREKLAQLTEQLKTIEKHLSELEKN